MLNLILFGIITIPWVIFPIIGIYDQFRYPKELFFNLLCLAVIAYSFCTGLRRVYINKWLSALTAWVLISIFINLYIPFAINIEQGILSINMATLFSSINFILGLWFAFIILSSLKIEDYLVIAKYICLSAVLVSIIGIFQLFGFDIFGSLGKYNMDRRICALLDNPNLLGNYLSLSLPFFICFKQKKYIIGFILVFIAIILARSSLSLICSVMGLLVFLNVTLRNKRIHIGSIILLSIFSLFVLYYWKSIILDFSGRLDIWKQALDNIKNNPIFGHGLGIFKIWGVKINGTLCITAHNDWIERVCELGLLSIALGLGLIFNSLKNFNYKIDNKIGIAYLSSFICFLIMMCGSFPMEYAPLYFMGIISFCAVETFKKGEENG